MLSLLPVLLLLITVILMWVFALIKLRAGTVWLVSAIMVSLAWGFMVFIGLINPEPIVLNQWLPNPHSFIGLVYSFTPQSWGIGYLLISLLTAIIYSEAKYLDAPGYIGRISGSILLTAIGLLAIMSGSLLGFVLAWSLIDLIEFGVIAVTMGQSRTIETAATSILFRIAGLFLLIALISNSQPAELNASLTGITTTSWGLIIFMVLFRMGALPMYQPYAKAPNYQRGIVTILRLLPLLTSYAFILFIGKTAGSAFVGEFWVTIVAVAILSGAVSFFAAHDELLGRPFFLLAMAGFGLTALMTGNYDTLPGFAAVLIAGAGLFLYFPRLPKINLFIIIMIAGLLLIPFTPTAPLTTMFTGEGSIAVKVLWGLALSFIVSGFIKHSLKRVEYAQPLESWMRLFHTVALYFIALSPWVLLVVLFKLQAQYIKWWPWILITFVTGLLNAAYLLFRDRVEQISSQHREIASVAQKAAGATAEMVKLSWLSQITRWFGSIVTKGVDVLARVMEGDGGILWSFLFIVLLLSLLLARLTL